MDHQNTVPSLLGPISGPNGMRPMPGQQPQDPETPLFMKLIFWTALGLLAFGAIRFFAR